MKVKVTTSYEYDFATIIGEDVQRTTVNVKVHDGVLAKKEAAKQLGVKPAWVVKVGYRPIQTTFEVDPSVIIENGVPVSDEKDDE